MIRKNALIFALLVPLLLAPTGTVVANMAPPPSKVWFTLEYKTDGARRLGAMQLVGCESEACLQPVLLQLYGRCEVPGCLPGVPSLSGFSTSFSCASNRCYSTAYPNHGGILFKLVARFADGVRTSKVAGKLPFTYGEQAAWRVVVRDADLFLVRITDLPSVDIPFVLFEHNLGWLALSILAEVVVAGIFLMVWARSGLRQWAGRLPLVVLVNLASLPVVWLTIPALGQFQTIGSRLLGIISLVISIFYVALLVIVYRSPRKVRLWAIPVLVLVFLATSAACLFMLALNYYGGTTIYVQGLPPTSVIALSEAFAVIAEALLFAVLCRQPLKVWWIWGLSLLMNAASFFMGLVMVGR